MDSLVLKINNKTCNLPDDASISIEQTSPLWNDSGTVSYPFPVPSEENMHIFGDLQSPESDARIDDFKGEPFELETGGITALTGTISVDEGEADDEVSVNLNSGLASFNDMIQGLNLNDIPLKDDIYIGGVAERVYIWHSNPTMNVNRALDPSAFMIMDNPNITDPYPLMPYCCSRIAVAKENPADGYNVLPANRPQSGLCFYVLYFLDCLFNHLGITVVENQLADIEDMCRLAFFNTKCAYDVTNEPYTVSESMLQQSIGFRRLYKGDGSLALTFDAWRVKANSNNFPSVTIESLINSLQYAFGARFMYNEANNSMRIICLKHVLKNEQVKRLACTVLDKVLVNQNFNGVTLKYDGDDDDTAFNYSDYSRAVTGFNYNQIIKNLDPFDKTCYIDPNTGNAYRIKVDEDATTEAELNAAVFEVGAFSPVSVGVTNEDDAEELTIDFKPIITNDVTPNESRALDNYQQILAPYIDVEMKNPKERELYYISSRGLGTIGLYYTSPVNFDMSANDESPLQGYDSGFTLGIMRGPGSTSAYEVVQTNVDGTGNNVYVDIAANSAFTADSVDNFGRSFDYNGTQAGIGDESERFSLKIRATKPGFSSSVYPNRGLYETFLTEYVNFLAKRKKARFKLAVSINEIFSIDWTVRYQIDEYVGYIDRINYDITQTGVDVIELEMYLI